MLEKAYEGVVYYDDTDAGGVMYYANYLKYCERGKQEFFIKHGCDLFKLHFEGVYLVVKEVKADYKKSLKLGDRFEVYVGVKKLRRASILLEFEITDGVEPAFTGEILSVSTDGDGNIVKLPDCVSRLLT